MCGGAFWFLDTFLSQRKRRFVKPVYLDLTLPQRQRNQLTLLHHSYYLHESFWSHVCHYQSTSGNHNIEFSCFNFAYPLLRQSCADKPLVWHAFLSRYIQHFFRDIKRVDTSVTEFIKFDPYWPSSSSSIEDFQLIFRNAGKTFLRKTVHVVREWFVERDTSCINLLKRSHQWKAN